LSFRSCRNGNCCPEEQVSATIFGLPETACGQPEDTWGKCNKIICCNEDTSSSSCSSSSSSSYDWNQDPCQRGGRRYA